MASRSSDVDCTAAHAPETAKPVLSYEPSPRGLSWPAAVLLWIAAHCLACWIACLPPLDLEVRNATARQSFTRLALAPLQLPIESALTTYMHTRFIPEWDLRLNWALYALLLPAAYLLLRRMALQGRSHRWPLSLAAALSLIVGAVAWCCDGITAYGWGGWFDGHQSRRVRGAGTPRA